MSDLPVVTDVAPAALPSEIHGGRRVAIERADESSWDWWVGVSPRNGRESSVEGSWADWVTLAHNILAAEAEANPAADVVLRVPFAQAKAHRDDLATAKTNNATLANRVFVLTDDLAAKQAELERLQAGLAKSEETRHRLSAMIARDAEKLGAAVALVDLTEVLLDEANEDSGAVAACLMHDDDAETVVNVVDTVRELCGRVRDLQERLTEERAERDNAAGVITNPVVVALQAKREPKAKTPVDMRQHVATRRDAHGRRFWDGAGWTDDLTSALDSARLDTPTLLRLKPRGCKLVAVDDVPALLAADAAKAAEKQAQRNADVDAVVEPVL